MTERRWLVHAEIGVLLLIEPNAKVETVNLLDVKSEIADWIHARRVARTAPSRGTLGITMSALMLRKACVWAQRMPPSEPISGPAGSHDQVKNMATETDHARGHWKDLSMTYEEALSRLPDALQREGFGIITQIDIQETFKAKLGVDFRRYRIFGACNPSFAHTALQNDPRVGVLLPCNVVLYEKDDGKAVVGAVDPMQTLGAGGSSAALADVARDVGARLERVLEGLAS